MDALIEEASKKAAVAWLDGRAVWCLWHNGALYVVHGPGEQPAPALALSTVDVTVRGDHGGAIVTWPASVDRVQPGTAEWDEVVPLLAAKRLNGSASPDRWARDCTVSRLSPRTAEQRSGPRPPVPPAR